VVIFDDEFATNELLRITVKDYENRPAFCDVTGTNNYIISLLTHGIVIYVAFCASVCTGYVILPCTNALSVEMHISLKFGGDGGSSRLRNHVLQSTL